MIGIGHCPIDHPLCTPHACAGCDLFFCQHEPTCRSVGYYDQFHSVECRDRKLAVIQQSAFPKIQVGGVAFVIEPEPTRSAISMVGNAWFTLILIQCGLKAFSKRWREHALWYGKKWEKQ